VDQNIAMILLVGSPDLDAFPPSCLTHAIGHRTGRGTPRLQAPAPPGECCRRSCGLTVGRPLPCPDSIILSSPPDHGCEGRTAHEGVIQGRTQP